MSINSLFDDYRTLVVFDTETTGLDYVHDQIIELAALRVELDPQSKPKVVKSMDTFIRLPDGEKLPERIVELTGITDEMLEAEGVSPAAAVDQFMDLMQGWPTLMIAHNAQFDANFLRRLLRGQHIGHIAWLDTVTVYKDRRAYPHKLANAILAYDLADKVRNSHRAIDDVLALFEVLKAMGAERDDLAEYINIFGYNNKYGISGAKIRGVQYYPQRFNRYMVAPDQTLPFRFRNGKNVSHN